MEQLEAILQFIQLLQEDENLDLSEYSTHFVDVMEQGQSLSEAISQLQEENEASKGTIESLKSENWDLSKRITKPEEKETEDEVEEEVEETEEEYETIDDAIEDLFKEGEEEDE